MNRSRKAAETVRSRRLGESVFVVLAVVVSEVIILSHAETGVFVPVAFGVAMSLFIAAKALLADTLRFSYWTIPSFFMLMYLALMPYGAIVTFVEMDHPMRYTYLLAVLSVLVTFPIGVALANSILTRPSTVIRRYVRSQLVAAPTDRQFAPTFFALLLLGIPILTMYLGYSEHVQLLEVIKKYPTNIDAVTLKFSGADDLPRMVQYSFEVLRRFILPLCVLFAYLMASTGRRSWQIAFWPLLVGGLFVSALTLDRAPPVAFLVMLVLGYILRTPQSLAKAFSNVRLLSIMTLAMIVGGIVSVLQYQSEFTSDSVISSAAYVLKYRILQDAPYMASTAFETFNESTGFLYGKYMRIFSLMPGFEYVESSDTIYSPAAPVGFVGDLWRNFGWPGVILGTVLIGFAYQTIQVKLFVRKTVFMLSIHVILLIGSIWIIHGNVLGVMSTSVMVLATVAGAYARQDRAGSAGLRRV